MSYKGPERRQGLPFNEDERKLINAMIKLAINQAIKDFPFDRITEQAADRAAEKLTKDIYAAVGKSVFQKLTMILGVLAIGALMWLESKGLFKK